MHTFNKKRSYLRALFFALLTISLSLGSVGCSDDNNGGNNSNPDANTVSGTLTFTYAGAPITDAAKWPHSSSTADAFGGYFRLGLMPSLATGQATAGPRYMIGGTGMGTGMEFTALTSSTYQYKFTAVQNDIYIIVPTYENIKATGMAKTVSVGRWGAISFAYGAPITVNSDAHANTNIYCDMAVGKYAYDAIDSAAHSKGMIYGGIKVNDAAKWPTGTSASGNYLALMGYKNRTSKADVVANPAMPDLYAVIPVPTVAGSDFVAFKYASSFGNPNGINFSGGDQTYGVILIDVLNSASAGLFVSPSAAALAEKTNVTFNATTPSLYWNADVTLP
ncbi:MAG: hypothetical protein HGB19_03960 [Chlorobiales bacterium]|nr:hypothetical protein [Chlorobiales bacterium]